MAKSGYNIKTSDISMHLYCVSSMILIKICKEVRYVKHNTGTCRRFEIKKKTINPYVTLTEDDVLKKLEISRQHAAEGKVRDADDVICDMRQKYGI